MKPSTKMRCGTRIVRIYEEDIVRITVLNGSPKGEQNVSSSYGAVQCARPVRVTAPDLPLVLEVSAKARGHGVVPEVRLTIARVRMDSGRLI